MIAGNPNAKPINLVLADDHHLLLDLWTTIFLKDNRFQLCGVATNGRDAINQSRRHRPDVVLLDIRMPEIDGFEATRQIRRYSPSSRIIGISMYNIPALAKKFLANGGSAYLTKYCSFEELIFAIAVVLKGQQYIGNHVQELMQTGESSTTRLSAREIEIASLIKSGLSSKEIGERLSISAKTVEIHRHNIFRKLDVSNLAGLISALYELGI